MQLPETTRSEIKIVTDSLNLPRVRSWLRVHRAAFYSQYPARQVNNVYFDTPHLDSYVENLSGGAARSKVRLRWYGDDAANTQCVFEVKRKQNMHGWKLSQRLSNALDLTQETWAGIIAALRHELEYNFRVYLDGRFPVLINRYQREYYSSFDGTARVTLDYSQVFFDQRGSGSPNLTIPVLISDDLVIEFKANTEKRSVLARDMADIPFRVSKHSKYTSGIEAILGY